MARIIVATTSGHGSSCARKWSLPSGTVIVEKIQRRF